MIIKINDPIFHPCSMDIIEHKVISVRQFEGFNHYVLKAIRNVGACGRVEVVIDEHKGKLRFVELLDEEDIEYASGLGDFIEGNYYTNKVEAELEFYSKQEVIARSNRDQKKRLLDEAEARVKQVELLVSELKNKAIAVIDNNPK